MPHELTFDQYLTYLNEIWQEPNWRHEADEAAAYYDGLQLDDETRDALQDRNQPEIVYNLIGPTIDAVLGMEARTRTDWQVDPEQERDDDDRELADAFTAKLQEAERIAEAGRALSDGYASQLKSGLGWVEVAREPNPFMPSPYRVQEVPRREIAWDWRAKRRDLRDARYLRRRRWYDLDQVKLAWPGKADLIEAAGTGWETWYDASPAEDTHSSLGHEYGKFTENPLPEEEWLDTGRRRILVNEMWYRVWRKGAVLKLRDGRVLEYDNNNLRHNMAVIGGGAKVEKAVFDDVRVSYWIGPHKLEDRKSPFPHSFFPYIPLWGYREDRSGKPYGLTRRMKGPQDEVNARRSKMMWLLSAKRIEADSDALDMPVQRAVDEVQRPDGYIRLNKDRRNPNAFQVHQNFTLADQQFQVMKDAEEAIQDTGGVYQSMLGKADSGADSGVAIQSLVEQGVTTLAELNDNYRHARKLVGEHLLALVKEDLEHQEEAEVRVDRTGIGDTKKVRLNTRDEQGRVRNNVARMRARVALSDVPSTPTYRAHVARELTEVTQSLPPEMQGAVIDIVVAQMDLPAKQRDEMLKRIRQLTGRMDPADMTEEERKQAEQRQAEQAAARKAELASKKAEAEEKAAKAGKAAAEAAQTEAETATHPQESAAEVAKDLASARASLDSGEEGGGADGLALVLPETGGAPGSSPAPRGGASGPWGPAGAGGMPPPAGPASGGGPPAGGAPAGGSDPDFEEWSRRMGRPLPEESTS